MIKFMYDNNDEEPNDNTRYQIMLTNTGEDIHNCFATFFRFMVACSYNPKQLENKMREIIVTLDEYDCEMEDIIWS